MPQWNTNTITNDLKNIVGVINIKNLGAQGKADTDNLVLEFGGVEDKLFVCGFSDTTELNDSTNECIDFVELTDGLNSSGGLNSHDFRLARAYIEVRQYFINRNFDVVVSKDF